MRCSKESVLKTESAHGVAPPRKGGTVLVLPLGVWAFPNDSAVTKRTSAMDDLRFMRCKPRSYSRAKGLMERTIPNCEQGYWRTQEFQLAYGFDPIEWIAEYHRISS